MGPPDALVTATVKPADRLPAAGGGCAAPRPIEKCPGTEKTSHEPTLRTDPSPRVAGRARGRGLVGLQAGCAHAAEHGGVPRLDGRRARALHGGHPDARRAL